jgi:hypothetical protein
MYNTLEGGGVEAGNDENYRETAGKKAQLMMQRMEMK